MDLHQVRFALLKISVVVLALSSWVFFSFVFETRPPENENIAGEQSADADDEIKPVDEMMKSLVRLPASLPAQLPGVMPAVLTGATAKVMTPVRMDVVHVPCWDKPLANARSAGARWVRLTGKTCGGDENAALEVSNLSNGYSATVFDAVKDDLTTDFIPLDRGKNEILIRYRHADGTALENRLVLNR